jgi:hypothetical protein
MNTFNFVVSAFLPALSLDLYTILAISSVSILAIFMILNSKDEVIDPIYNMRHCLELRSDICQDVLDTTIVRPIVAVSTMQITYPKGKTWRPE